MASLTMAENAYSYININDYGDEVIALHKKLRELGYYHLRAESPLSRKCAEAVKILQENLGKRSRARLGIKKIMIGT